MSRFSPSNIRNFVLVGQGGSGKTMITERLLFRAGASQRVGRVEDGTTVSDYLDEEVRRHISTSIGLCEFDYKGVRLNLLDTPGYADFMTEAQEAVRVADTALLAINAGAGVEVQTPRFWNLCEAQAIPVAFVVNKVDLENVDFDSRVAELQKTFGHKVATLTIPIASGPGFSAFVDVVTGKVYSYPAGKDEAVISDAIPDNVRSDYEAARLALTEAVAESDDAMMEKYLGGEALSQDELTVVFAKAFKNRQVFPVVGISALKGIGCDYLMEFLASYAPSPSEIRVQAKRKGTDDVVELRADPSARPAAFVFKTTSDPFVGKLSFVRIYSGRIAHEIYNGTKDVSEKVGGLFHMIGKKQEALDEGIAGDIVVISKLVATTTNDTITSKDDPIELAPIVFSQPLLMRSLKPKSRADDDKLSSTLSRLKEEEPAIVIEKNAETHETIMRGLGEAHLQVIVERLQKKFGVNIDLEVPRVPYRETIKGHARVEGKHKKQTGGHGQYGDCWIEMEPNERGGGWVFENKVFGGAIPKQFIPAIEKGMLETMSKGQLAGYPAVDIKVAVVDGSYHPVDSSEMAFKLAGSLAFKKAFEQCNPILLEPIVALEVTVDEKYMGDVMGDLTSKRGKISGMENTQGKQTIKAFVPLSEMLNYGIDLGSITQGTGVYSMKVDHYEEVPERIAEKIIADAKANAVAEEEE
ncbi:MAG: elongation factor G [Candidatus Cryosericum sp.]|nr:elongation factor G [bacterium]